MTKLNPIDEAMFQSWYRNLPMVESGRMNPNPDDPEHFYDMRAAFLQNRGQVKGEDTHFPSQFKLIGHPRDYLGGVDTVHDYGMGQQLADLLDPMNLARGTRGR